MFRKTLLALMGLMVVPSLLAQGGPNPGAINPGSRVDEQQAFIFGNIAPLEQCFEQADWCTLQYERARLAAFTNTPVDCDESYCVGTAEAFARASIEAALHCEAAAEANASLVAHWQAGGRLELWRHGNNGSMHHINFMGGARGGALLIIDASAEAIVGSVRAAAYASTSATSVSDFCDIGIQEGWIVEEVKPWQSDDLIWDFCQTAESIVSAESTAIAYAESAGMGAGSAIADLSVAAGQFNEVYAANIEEYRADVQGGIGAFVEGNSGALAGILSGAYTRAYARARAKACAGVEDYAGFVYDEEFCSLSNAHVQAEALRGAGMYAAAGVGVLFSAAINYNVTAEYINLPGGYDNDIKNFSVELNGGRGGFAGMTCYVPPDPDPEPESLVSARRPIE